MNTKTIEKNWSEIKGKIKAKWSKISDEQIESAKSDLNLLSARVQTAYGIAKEEAERQYTEFKKSVQTLVSDDSQSTPAKEPATAAAPIPGAKPVTQPSDSSHAV